MIFIGMIAILNILIYMFDENQEQDSISNDLLDLIWLKLDELNESIK